MKEAKPFKDLPFIGPVFAVLSVLVLLGLAAIVLGLMWRAVVWAWS